MTTSGKSIPLPRKLAYASILTVLLLALVLGALEGGLRLVGYGYSPHFARRVKLEDGSAIWRENRWCTAPFFSPELVRRPQPMRLPVVKAPGTYRVFVLGSSAAMGDPEASFSLARVLEKELGSAYSGIRFEVVNAGITAINSHLVRGIARDCSGLKPDLFIVYEGNNEVIGPFGPSGVFTPFLDTGRGVRLAVSMKGTRTGQLIAAVGRAVASRGESGRPAEWGGMEMFLSRQIAVDDPRLDAVRAGFRANLLAISSSAGRAGATTLLCTVATNQRGFAPFASLHRADLTAADLALWERAFAEGDAAMRANDARAAEHAYRAALAIDDKHAELLFRLGRLALQSGRHDDAQEFLQRAVDCDALRFRTDSSLNRVILDLAGAQETSGLQVVDVAAALAAASPAGICGDEFFYEHVHLTLRGTHQVASALMPAIHADLVRRGMARGELSPPIDYDELRLRLGFTAYEQGMISTEMHGRVQRAPFTGQSDHRGREDFWRRGVEAAASLLERPEATSALRAVYDGALEVASDDWILARNAGMMLVARGAASEAVPYLEKARAWIDDDPDTLAALSVAMRRVGRTDEAAVLLDRIRILEPRHPIVSQAK